MIAGPCSLVQRAVRLRIPIQPQRLRYNSPRYAGIRGSRKEASVFSDPKEYRSLRKRYNGKMFLSGVGVFREFEDLEVHALADGALSQKYKELIALAVSITHSCYGCVEYHVTRAMELGASHKEVMETTAVALALGGGVVQWPARYVFRVLEDLEKSGADGKAASR
jgi:AhpD family alkylhydroperoxidase